MSNSERFEIVEIDYDDIATETDLAKCFDIAGDEIWIPDSQIRVLDLDSRMFSIPRWLAEEKGLV